MTTQAGTRLITFGTARYYPKMTKRTVLVTGATGLLGREVAKTFRLASWTVKGTGYSRADGVDTLKVDLQNESEVAKVLDETKFVPPRIDEAAKITC